MPSLILWILAVYGLVFFLSDSEIFESWIPIRPFLRRSRFLKSLMSCYFCTGTYVSFGLWLLWTWPQPWRREIFFYVPAGAASAYIIDRVVLLVEIITSGSTNQPTS